MRSSIAAMALALSLAGSAGSAGPVAEYPISRGHDFDWTPRLTGGGPRQRNGKASAARKVRNRRRNKIARQSRKANRP